MQVDIYSDIACPWCYIGKARFTRALRAFARSDEVEVAFRPFQLDPSASTTPRPLKERLKEKFGPQMDDMIDRTTSAAEEEGLDLRFDEVQSVNTFSAHQLLDVTLREYGTSQQQRAADRLFEAYFSEGRNIADREVLLDIADDAGLDRQGVEEYLGSESGRTRVKEAIERARQMGIRAVPTFVFDNTRALQGAQAPSAFLQVLEEMVSSVEVDAEKSAGDACADDPG